MSTIQCKYGILFSPKEAEKFLLNMSEHVPLLNPLLENRTGDDWLDVLAALDSRITLCDFQERPAVAYPLRANASPDMSYQEVERGKYAMFEATDYSIDVVSSIPVDQQISENSPYPTSREMRDMFWSRASYAGAVDAELLPPPKMILHSVS